MKAVFDDHDLYFTKNRPVAFAQIHSFNSSNSLPIYYAYTNIPFLPDVHIDDDLGFVPHFLAFTYDWDMLNQCLDSFYESKVGWQNVVLVDNSPGKLAVKRRDWLARKYGHMIIAILPTSSLLSFSHLQNLFLDIAQQSKCDFYSWSHMDIMLLPLSEDWAIAKENINKTVGAKSSDAHPHTVYTKMLNSIRQANRTENNWSVIFYHYDLVIAVRTSAYISNGPFDIYIPQYTADCDYYRRLKLSGYVSINQHIVHIFHMPKVLKNELVEELKTCAWKRAKEILHISADDGRDINRTQWRRNNMRIADREAEPLLYTAGLTYYQKKWNTRNCGLKNNEPNWNLDPIIT
ncbi:unnamed protein product [Adineta ricciae]|uniref:Uncharacterized protein n=1 Tax=Adineta ricciae TaxID=249248 RepID=A0A815L0A4_ADIRI|nr:unnamed protein product [Adineta ricciae]